MNPERHDVNESVDERLDREDRADEIAKALARKLSVVTRGQWRRDLAVVAALLIVLFGCERYFQIQDRNRGRAEIVEGIYQNCVNDFAWREQLRQRGVAEDKLIEALIADARARDRANIDFPPGSAEKFIERFEPFAEEIVRLPLPDCAAERDAIFEALDESD